jgi:pSer/pThr/pTyr-binding forkhead associated (FHA) protein
VYAPNEYAVWLSPEDRALYEGVEAELIEELCAHLLEHARRENLMLASSPQILFHTDEQLRLGEFGIEARLVRPEDLQPPAAQSRPPAAPSQSSVSEEWLGDAGPEPSRARREAVPSQSKAVPSQSRAAPSQSTAVPSASTRRPSRAMLLVGDRRVLVPPPGAVVGRSRECDIVLEDAGVSRRHAELRPTEDGWLLVDLGSTNGVRVNDRPLRGRYSLQLGDRIELGSTELVFEVR